MLYMGDFQIDFNFGFQNASVLEVLNNVINVISL